MSQNTTQRTPDDGETPDEQPSIEAEPMHADDEADGPVALTHAPPRLNQGITVVAALFGTLLTAPFSAFSLPFGIGGFALMTAGIVYTHSRGWLSIGLGLILTGAIITGAYGSASPEILLMGVSLAIIAWDVGQHGIVIGQQLGRETRSRRMQLIHPAISAIVIGVISIIGYVGFLFAGSGRQASGVATVILGIVLVAWVLRS